MAENTTRPQAGSSGNRFRKRRRKNHAALTVLKVLGTLLLVGVITCALLACFAAVYIKNVILPMTPLDAADFPTNLSSTIYYIDSETGEEVEYETLHGDEDRIPVKYEDIPDTLIKAAVAIEDRRFYQHKGVDWLRTGKSILLMFTGGNIQGGSTITQQTIKNTTHYDDVTVKRKVVEIFQALEYEKRYSKRQILEQYLNRIYFGRKCYGVYTASYMYFGKELSELSLAECASLISITNNPSLYDPYTQPENNKTRRGLVLDAMLRDGYISEEECKAAKEEVIDFHRGHRDGQESSLYSWYTEQVITDVLHDLQEQYGYAEVVAKDILYSGGLKIYACIDPKVQAAVDNIYSDSSNLDIVSASGQQLQSAITVVDPQGNIVALAGKMGEKTAADTRGYNMATRALRQPGSSIKPIAVYAPALEMGLVTPYTVIEDSPSDVLNERPWPVNANGRWQGQMTVLNALTHSINTVAIRLLNEYVTPSASYEFLVNTFGVDQDHLVVRKTVNGKEYTDLGLPQLALGGLTQGVSTLDMAGAFAVFQRNGVYIEPRSYSRVENANGKVILAKDTTGEPVLKESTVYYINQMLTNVVRAGTGGGAQIPGMTVAGKTGTTTAENDLWFVGYTPYYTAAVWVGYQRPEKVYGASAPRLWQKVMSQVHEGLTDPGFPTSSGLVSVEYCMDTGKLATENCRNDIRGSRVATGKFFPTDVPTDYCEAHVQVEVCTADPILKEDGTPTGRYHIAGENCPDAEEDEAGNKTPGKITISVLDMERKYAGDIPPEDDVYFLHALEEKGECSVHTEPIVVEPEPYDPSKFDINNPTTWPTKEQDPNFDPGDQATWPSNPPTYPDLEPTAQPSEGPEYPWFTPPPVESEPVFTPPPTETDSGEEEDSRWPFPFNFR